MGGRVRAACGVEPDGRVCFFVFFVEGCFVRSARSDLCDVEKQLSVAFAQPGCVSPAAQLASIIARSCAPHSLWFIFCFRLKFSPSRRANKGVAEKNKMGEKTIMRAAICGRRVGRLLLTQRQSRHTRPRATSMALHAFLKVLYPSGFALSRWPRRQDWSGNKPGFFISSHFVRSRHIPIFYLGNRRGADPVGNSSPC